MMTDLSIDDVLVLLKISQEKRQRNVRIKTNLGINSRIAFFLMMVILVLEDEVPVFLDEEDPEWFLNRNSFVWRKSSPAQRQPPSMGECYSIEVTLICVMFFVLFCFVLFCFVLFCFVLFCFVLFCCWVA